MIPFTRVIVGTSIGLQAAIVPLTGAAPFIARMVENALLEIPTGLSKPPARWAPRRCRSCVRFCCLKRCRAGERGNHHAYHAGRLFRDGRRRGRRRFGQIGYQYGYIGYNATVMNTVLVLLVILVYLIHSLAIASSGL
jgi:D-methionine transport system permease protein